MEINQASGENKQMSILYIQTPSITLLTRVYREKGFHIHLNWTPSRKETRNQMLSFKGLTKQLKMQKVDASFSSPSHTIGSPKYAKNLDCLLTLQCNCCHISDALQYLTNTPNSNQVDVISLRNAEKTLLA